ncbi:hypothetical protein GW17_00037097 [Ensete ventricosum]|nr:hypothetical protein GW17_00037097 [Ensete ventricosum]
MEQCNAKDHSWPPTDSKQLSAKLKALTACGRLIKVLILSFSEEKSSKFLLLEGRQKEPRVDIKPLSKSQVDSELTRMRNMTAQEAAAFAAQAVAEAEAAITEAEQAAKEAEVAEADAEAAQAFAEAAIFLKPPKLIVVEKGMVEIQVHGPSWHRNNGS